MEQDEIIREVRAIREAYAERFGFDIEALYADAKKREGLGGRPVVHLEPRLIDPEADGPSDAESVLADAGRKA